MPVRTPGSSTSAGNPKYRSVMARSSTVTRGTPEEIATPSIFSSSAAAPVTPAPTRNGEKPWNPRNCWIMSASSSAVRSTTVAMRQWSTSSLPSKRPMTVWVFPVSMQSSIATRARTSSPMSSAGADCVIALVDTMSTPASANDRTFSSVMPPDSSTSTSGRGAVAHDRHAFLRLLGRHVVEHHEVGARRDRLGRPARRAHTPPRHRGPATARVRA